jgi:hypothetical protein
MHRLSTVTFACAAICLVFASPAAAQILTEAPAVARGGAICATKYPGSFLDIGTGACWECPATHPNRTIFPVNEGWACERPAAEVFSEVDGPRNPTGWLGTDCPRGWFLDIGHGKCYSCPSGYNRSLLPVGHARACSRVVRASWVAATRKGTEGCPDGAFRNGLTGYCFQCPTGFVRNLLIADDLTKINACTRVSLATGSEAMKALFDAEQAAYETTRDVLGHTASGMRSYDPVTGLFDIGARAMMKDLVDSEMLHADGFYAVTWLVSLGTSALLGYTYSYGYTMSKVDDAYQCRKVQSHAFTAGLAVGAGATFAIVLQGGVSEGLSESNGWQVGAAYPPVSGGWGLHWDATTGALSQGYNFGPALQVDATLSEYAHGWTITRGIVDCDKMTWGTGWDSL